MCDSGSGLVFTPAGYQGAAQHTYTPACDGFHAGGPCPPSQAPVEIPRGTDWARTTYAKGGPIQEGTS